MPRSFARTLLALVLLPACGGDSGSPNDGTLAGTWTYQADGLADVAYQGLCAIAPTSMTLTQTGDSLHGTTAAPSFLICTPTGGSPDTITTIPAGLSVRGDVLGGTVSFEIDGPYWTHTGVRTGDDMSGSASLTTQVGAQLLAMTGTWAGSR